jgi:hypothetical protein
MRIRLAPAAAAALCALIAVPVMADEQASKHDPNSGRPLPPDKRRLTPSPINDRFYAEGIYYPAHVKTDLRVDPHEAPAGTIGTPIRAESVLGLESRVNYGLPELMFRFGNRNKIRLDWLEVDRSATHQLNQTIDFGNETFVVNSLLASHVDWRIFTVTYTYSFIHNDRMELGTGVAAHFLQAEAQGSVALTQQRQDVTGAGAFPTIPLDFAIHIWRGLSVTARAQYFHASVSNFDGYLADIHEDVQYRIKPNFAVGLGYSSVRAKLALRTGGFPGLFAMSLEGPTAFFRVSF